MLDFFLSIDVDGTGYVDFSEFAFSLMGEAALNFGALADLETLSEVLKDTAHLLEGMKADLANAQMSTEERAARNADLRKRMEDMKRNTAGEMSNLMGKMMSIFGQDPAELLTDEQIDQLLNATFKVNFHKECHLRGIQY